MYAIFPTAEREGYIYNIKKQKGCPPGASPYCISQHEAGVTVSWLWLGSRASRARLPWGWLTNNSRPITQTKGPDNSKPMTPTRECATLTLSWLSPLLEQACECAGGISLRPSSESPVPDSQGHAKACLVLYNRDNG